MQYELRFRERLTMLEDRSALLRSSEFEPVVAKKTSTRRRHVANRSSTVKVAESPVFCSLAQEILPQPEALLLDSSSPTAGEETHSHVGKRGVAPILKALGGPIPRAAVFVPAEQIRTLLFQRHQSEKPRQSAIIDVALYLKPAPRR